MFQSRWVKLVGRTAKVIGKLFHFPAKQLKLFADEIGRTGQVSAQHVHLVSQHRHPLVHVVMKLSRQSFALLFLHGEEICRQSSELFLALA